MPFAKGNNANPKGRPVKREKHAGAIARAEKQIVDRLPELIGLQFELAQGVMVQETERDGSTNVYTRPPDRQAIEYLVNRIMGKPTERQEQATVQSGTVRVVVEYRDPEPE